MALVLDGGAAFVDDEFGRNVEDGCWGILKIANHFIEIKIIYLPMKGAVKYIA